MLAVGRARITLFFLRRHQGCSNENRSVSFEVIATLFLKNLRELQLRRYEHGGEEISIVQ